MKFTTLPIVFILTLFMFSCSNEDQLINNEDLINFKLEQDINLNFSRQFKIINENIQEISYNNNNIIFAVPISIHNVQSNDKNEIKSFAVYEQDEISNELKFINVYSVISFDGDIEQNLFVDILIKQYFNTFWKVQFNGSLLVFDSKMNIENSYLLKKDSSSFYESKFSSKQNLKSNCTDWYLYTYINGILVSTVYLYTTCTTPSIEPGFEGGGAGNGNCRTKVKTCSTGKLLDLGDAVAGITIRGVTDLTKRYNTCTPDICTPTAEAALNITGVNIGQTVRVEPLNCSALHLGADDVRSTYRYKVHNGCSPTIGGFQGCLNSSYQVKLVNHFGMGQNCSCG